MHATVLLVRGYHHCGASLSEQYIADLMFCHGTQPCITAGFVTVGRSKAYVVSKASSNQAV